MNHTLACIGGLLLALAPVLCMADEGPIQRALFVAGEEGYHTYRIPSLIVTKEGSLLAFCEARKNSAADDGDIDLIVRRSTDNGATWSNRMILADDGQHTMGNPCPVIDQRTGTIWLPYCRDNKQVFIIASNDDGQTWSTPKEITSDVKKEHWNWYATGPGVGIQTSQGRLIVPCDNHDSRLDTQQSHIIYSDDGGRTWKLGGIIGPQCDECQIVERSDGTLLLNIRSYRGNNRRLVAISNNGSQSFDPPIEDSTLIEPICQASMIRYPGHNAEQLFSNPASTKREKLTVRLSQDEGQSWPIAKVLHEGPAAYSCLAVMPNGYIGCLYERGDHTPNETITFAYFSRDWLLAPN